MGSIDVRNQSKLTFILSIFHNIFTQQQQQFVKDYFFMKFCTSKMKRLYTLKLYAFEIAHIAANVRCILRKNKKNNNNNSKLACWYFTFFGAFYLLFAFFPFLFYNQSF